MTSARTDASRSFEKSPLASTRGRGRFSSRRRRPTRRTRQACTPGRGGTSARRRSGWRPGRRRGSQMRFCRTRRARRRTCTRLLRRVRRTGATRPRERRSSSFACFGARGRRTARAETRTRPPSVRSRETGFERTFRTFRTTTTRAGVRVWPRRFGRRLARRRDTSSRRASVGKFCSGASPPRREAHRPTEGPTGPPPPSAASIGPRLTDRMLPPSRWALGSSPPGPSARRRGVCVFSARRRGTPTARGGRSRSPPRRSRNSPPRSSRRSTRRRTRPTRGAGPHSSATTPRRRASGWRRTRTCRRSSTPRPNS